MDIEFSPVTESIVATFGPEELACLAQIFLVVNQVRDMPPRVREFTIEFTGKVADALDAAGA